MDDRRARQGAPSYVDGPVIPLELWRTVATFLDKRDVGAVRATSKTLRACVDATRDELRLVAWKRPYRMWGDDVWMSKLLLRSPNVRSVILYEEASVEGVDGLEDDYNARCLRDVSGRMVRAIDEMVAWRMRRLRQLRSEARWAQEELQLVEHYQRELSQLGVMDTPSGAALRAVWELQHMRWRHACDTLESLRASLDSVLRHQQQHLRELQLLDQELRGAQGQRGEQQQEDGGWCGERLLCASPGGNAGDVDGGTRKTRETVDGGEGGKEEEGDVWEGDADEEAAVNALRRLLEGICQLHKRHVATRGGGAGGDSGGGDSGAVVAGQGAQDDGLQGKTVGQRDGRTQQQEQQQALGAEGPGPVQHAARATGPGQDPAARQPDPSTTAGSELRRIMDEYSALWAVCRARNERVCAELQAKGDATQWLDGLAGSPGLVGSPLVSRVLEGMLELCPRGLGVARVSFVNPYSCAFREPLTLPPQLSSCQQLQEVRVVGASLDVGAEARSRLLGIPVEDGGGAAGQGDAGGAFGLGMTVLPGRQEQRGQGQGQHERLRSLVLRRCRKRGLGPDLNVWPEALGEALGHRVLSGLRTLDLREPGDQDSALVPWTAPVARAWQRLNGLGLLRVGLHLGEEPTELLPTHRHGLLLPVGPHTRELALAVCCSNRLRPRDVGAAGVGVEDVVLDEEEEDEDEEQGQEPRGMPYVRAVVELVAGSLRRAAGLEPGWRGEGEGAAGDSGGRDSERAGVEEAAGAGAAVAVSELHTLELVLDVGPAAGYRPPGARLPAAHEDLDTWVMQLQQQQPQGFLHPQHPFAELAEVLSPFPHLHTLSTDVSTAACCLAPALWALPHGQLTHVQLRVRDTDTPGMLLAALRPCASHGLRLTLLVPPSRARGPGPWGPSPDQGTETAETAVLRQDVVVLLSGLKQVDVVMTCAMEVGAVQHHNHEWRDFAHVLSVLRHVPCLRSLRLLAWVPRGPALGPLERCLRMTAACLPQLRTLALVVQEFKHQGTHPSSERLPADSFAAAAAAASHPLDPLGQHLLDESYTVLPRRATAGWRAARAAALQGADLDTWHPAASTTPTTPNDSPSSSASAPPSTAPKLVPSLAPLASLPCLSRLELHLLLCEPFGVCGQAEREVRQLLLGVGRRRLGVWCPQLSRRAARELSRLALELQGGAGGGGPRGTCGEFEWRVDCSPPTDSVDLSQQGGAVDVMSVGSQAT